MTRNRKKYNKNISNKKIKFLSQERLFTILALIVLILLLWPTVKNYSQRKAIDREINSIKAEIDKFQVRNQELTDMMNYLNSGQALEETARLNFGLKKEGEQVIVVKDEDVLELSLDNNLENNLETQEALSTPQRWWRYFFN